MKDIMVEITEHKEGVTPKKISSLTWVNPEVKVKIEEKEGIFTFI